MSGCYSNFTWFGRTLQRTLDRFSVLLEIVAAVQIWCFKTFILTDCACVCVCVSVAVYTYCVFFKEVQDCIETAESNDAWF